MLYSFVSSSYNESGLLFVCFFMFVDCNPRLPRVHKFMVATNCHVQQICCVAQIVVVVVRHVVSMPFLKICHIGCH